jgi:hypothetical protein
MPAYSSAATASTASACSATYPAPSGLGAIAPDINRPKLATDQPRLPRMTRPSSAFQISRLFTIATSSSV